MEVIIAVGCVMLVLLVIWLMWLTHSLMWLRADLRSHKDMILAAARGAQAAQELALELAKSHGARVTRSKP